MPFVFIHRQRDESPDNNERSHATNEPIEPDIGVGGWGVMGALFAVVLFFYHWGSILVWGARFVLDATPYALVRADERAPKPLHHEDVVFIRRGAAALRPGQILWVQSRNQPRLAKLL